MRELQAELHWPLGERGSSAVLIASVMLQISSITFRIGIRFLISKTSSFEYRRFISCAPYALVSSTYKHYSAVRYFYKIRRRDIRGSHLQFKNTEGRLRTLFQLKSSQPVLLNTFENLAV